MSSTYCVPLETLILVIVKLDSQRNQVSFCLYYSERRDMLIIPKLLNTPPMSLDSCFNYPQPGFTTEIPRCFTTLEQAQNSLYFHRNRCLKAAFEWPEVTANGSSAKTWTNKISADYHTKSLKLFQDTSTKWASAFQAFLERYSMALDSTSLQGAAVLKINQLIATLCVESYNSKAPEYQTPWDNYRPMCEEIIDLATTIVRMQGETDRSTACKKAPVFSLDVSIVAPLHMVAYRCRDPTLRRRAIALLYSAPRQEGLWHSILTARVCEKIMQVEERGLGQVNSCEDIPDCNRITKIDGNFDMQDRKGYLRLSRASDNSPGFGHGVEVVYLYELIEW